MKQFDINGSDNATVHVFHLDLPPEAVERFTVQAGTGEWPLKYGLGAKALNGGFVDVVDLRDLGKMPLSQYLGQAHTVAPAVLREASAQLDTLTGHVVILPPPAFERVSQTLTISTPLRHVGSYAERSAKRPGPALRSKAAKGEAGMASADRLPRRASTLTKALLLGAVILCLLLLALLLR